MKKVCTLSTFAPKILFLALKLVKATRLKKKLNMASQLASPHENGMCKRGSIVKMLPV